MITFPKRPSRARVTGIIPLVDVAMFLLIFFMVAGSIERFEIIPVEPPKAENSKLMDEGHIVILLGKRDEIVVGDDLVSLADMEATVKGLLKENPAKIITVKADATIPAMRMLAVMDALKRAGADSLSIATERKRSEAL
jgi:biopolymer transport protein ExbD